MIKKIIKIRNYQIFDNFKWHDNDDLQSFKACNLIYGWNGTGKTTLSNIFRSLEKGEESIEGVNSSFRLETNNGTLNSSNLSNNELQGKIKVFNRIFVDENIFKTDGDVEPIFVLGEVDYKKEEKIQELKEQKNRFDEELKDNEITSKSLIEKQNKLCTDQARIIKKLLSAKGVLRYINYDSSKLENKYEELKNIDDLTSKKLKTDEENELLRMTHSNPKNKLNEISFDYSDIKKINEMVSTLIEETVGSITIKRFEDDSDLNEWAERGLEIHKRKKAVLCQFCEQKLPPDLLNRLKAHFDNTFKVFISKIELQISEFEEEEESIESFKKKMHNKDLLYDEFSIEYEQSKTELETELDKYGDLLNSMVKILKDKRKNPFTVPKFEVKILEIEIEEKLNKYNKLVFSHNSKTDNFQNEIEKARAKIEESYILEIMPDYKKNDNKLDELKKEHNRFANEIAKKESKIKSLEDEMSGHTKSAEEINKKLASYLGHKDIKLESEEKGYSITIRGEKVDTLSEGEKTALAFTYFLQSLEERGFDLEKSIVVIDDPISSLDSNSLFHAFGLMKECLMKKDTKGKMIIKAKQIFILTHNFAFFRQVKRWFGSEFGNIHELYMLKNIHSNGKRTAALTELDSLLKDYETEYHYLFSQVHRYSQKNNENLENYYNLPNMSRRLLESFLAFRIPNIIKNKKFEKQLEELKFDDKVKINKIIRFLNTYSHRDYIDTTESELSFLIETKEILKAIMDLIEKEDPEHHKRMLEVIETSNRQNTI